MKSCNACPGPATMARRTSIIHSHQFLHSPGGDPFDFHWRLPVLQAACTRMVRPEAGQHSTQILPVEVAMQISMGWCGSQCRLIGLCRSSIQGANTVSLRQHGARNSCRPVWRGCVFEVNRWVNRHGFSVWATSGSPGSASMQDRVETLGPRSIVELSTGQRKKCAE